MEEGTQLIDFRQYDLKDFAELLAPRDPIIGERPGSFEAIHVGLMASLAPATPYECVIAENLIAIAWELVQHRAMRENFLRRKVAAAVFRELVDLKTSEHNQVMDKAWEDFTSRGGDGGDWEDPLEFDREAAEAYADRLTNGATSPDISARHKAWEELREFRSIMGCLNRAKAREVKPGGRRHRLLRHYLLRRKPGRMQALKNWGEENRRAA